MKREAEISSEGWFFGLSNITEEGVLGVLNTDMDVMRS